MQVSARRLYHPPCESRHQFYQKYPGPIIHLPLNGMSTSVLRQSGSLKGRALRMCDSSRPEEGSTTRGVQKELMLKLERVTQR